MPSSHKTALEQKVIDDALEAAREKKKHGEPAFKALEKADEIALYYGFTPIETPTIQKADTNVARVLKEIEPAAKDSTGKSDMGCSYCLEGKIAVLRTYIEEDMQNLSQPVMLYYKGVPGIAGFKKTASKDKRYGLEIIGTSKSVAEATIIKTAFTILSEELFQDLYVDINSIGDKDSTAKFTRELNAYYKKHLSELDPTCRQTFKKDVFEVLSCTHSSCQVVHEKAPQSISFLSEPSRRHFREVLEYLETMNIPYRIKNSLVGKKCCSQTIFEIHSLSLPLPLAVGMRYDSITKRMGFKKEIPAIGLKLSFRPMETKVKKMKSVVIKKPKFYFIQLGFDAKLKSLQVIEILRQAKIPLYQSLSKDKLAMQMSTAENLKIPYVLIMGQKEAMEDSVIVRNMNTRSQDTIKIDTLPQYLEKIK